MFTPGVFEASPVPDNFAVLAAAEILKQYPLDEVMDYDLTEYEGEAGDIADDADYARLPLGELRRLMEQTSDVAQQESHGTSAEAASRAFLQVCSNALMALEIQQVESEANGASTVVATCSFDQLRFVAEAVLGTQEKETVLVGGVIGDALVADSVGTRLVMGQALVETVFRQMFLDAASQGSKAA